MLYTKHELKGTSSKKKVYNVDDFENIESETDYAFYIAEYVKVVDKSNGSVDLKVGGFILKDVLIDSGATCHIVNDTMWESLKHWSIKCSSEASQKQLFAYGQSKPIET